MKYDVEADRRRKNEREEQEDHNPVWKEPDYQGRQNSNYDSADMNDEIIAQGEACSSIVPGPISELWQFLEYVKHVSQGEEPHGLSKTQRTKSANDLIEIHCFFAG